MHSVFALLPLSTANAEVRFDVSLVEVLVRIGHVIAQRRIFALSPDVVHVELRVQRVSDNYLRQKLACLQSYHVQAHADHLLADEVAALQEVILSGANEVVLVSEVRVLRVLLVRVDPPVSNCNSLEVHSQISHVVDEVVGNGRNVVASVGFASDIEVSAFVLRVLLEEALKEKSHVCSNFILISFVVSDASAFTEASSNRLVDVDHICDVVPGIAVVL